MASKPHTMSAADKRAQERVRGMGAVAAMALEAAGKPVGTSNDLAVSPTASSASSDLPLDILGREIRERIERGDKALKSGEEHYMAAGLQLLDAKRRLAETKVMSFRAFLEQHGIGRSRSYDLIAVAEGTKTFDGIRAKASGRMAKHLEQSRSARLSVNDGQSDEPVARIVADPMRHSVKQMLPEDMCARFWAYKLSADQPKGAWEHSRKAMNEVFAKLKTEQRLEVMEGWYSSLPREERLKLHNSCIHPNLPSYMGNWVVDALLEMDYRPDDELSDGEREGLALAEMGKALDIYDAWPIEQRGRLNRVGPVAAGVDRAFAAYDALTPDERLAFHEARPGPTAPVAVFPKGLTVTLPQQAA